MTAPVFHYAYQFARQTAWRLASVPLYVAAGAAVVICAPLVLGLYWLDAHCGGER